MPSFEIEKLVSGKLIDEFVGDILPHDHGGEKDGVERDIVFSDELDVVGFGVEPVVFPGVGIALELAHSWVAEI